MTNIFEGKISTKVEIRGTTVINHAARVQLGLNCSEYVLMEYIVRKAEQKKELLTSDVYEHLGFSEAEQQPLIISLYKKGFVLPIEKGIPVITAKWNTAFADLHKEFEELFWKKDGKVFWPASSSKKNSDSKYYKIRKKYSREFLIEQRNWYEKYLELQVKVRNFPQAKMMCDKFLGPKELFLSNWKGACEELEEEFKSKNQPTEKTETLTDEERKKAYEQNSQNKDSEWE